MVLRQPEAQLVAALRAMTEANVALRQGLFPDRAIARARLCLRALADNDDLAPELRFQCDALGEQWRALGRPRGHAADLRDPCPAHGATVIPLKR